MSQQLKALIDEIQELSLLEQVELISAVSELLQNNYKQLPINNDFWQSKSLEQLSKEQQIQAVKSVSDLAADFWPEEESVDEFNEYIYKQRHEV